jgi:hypothetical protein
MEQLRSADTGHLNVDPGRFCVRRGMPATLIVAAVFGLPRYVSVDDIDGTDILLMSGPLDGHTFIGGAAQEVDCLSGGF